MNDNACSKSEKTNNYTEQLKYKICKSCLKRLINKEIKREQYFKGYKTCKPESCDLCEGLTTEIDKFVDLTKENVDGYEFETFLIGVKIDEDLLKKEQEIIDILEYEKIDFLKNFLKREIGKKLEEKLKKEVNFEKPAIMIIIDTSFDTISLQISALYIYGRYNKYVRDIPQTRWLCKICWGKGCKKCSYTGKIYQDSIEERIAKVFLEHSLGENQSFHGSGREDVDVKMLGNGRPFVIELLNPKIRNIDLKQIEKEINQKNKDIINVKNLHFSSKEEIIRIKNSEFNKTYKVTFKSEKIINNEKLKKVVLSLRGLRISQFTPLRVAHRRAEMIREKHIYNCEINELDENRVTLTLETQSGTYIKELITGDNGRTTPSISEMLGIPCIVEKLDVIEIKGE